jgi:hypothetical protein
VERTRRAISLVQAIATFTVLVAHSTRLSAQAAPAFDYGAFVDAAYANSFNDPPNHLFRNRGTTPRVDELDLNMAGAYVRKIASDASRWGVEATVQAGEDSKLFGFSATAPNITGADWLRHLGPTNGSYIVAAGRGVTVQGGIFSSLIGYDSLYAKDNLNYTRPWGADYTPYLMLGVNAAYPLSDQVTLTAIVVNGYWHLAHANDVPSLGGQIAYKPTAPITIKQTVLYGPHQSNTSLEFWRLLSDTIVERKTERLTLAFEVQVGEENVDSVSPVRAWWFAAQAPVRWRVQGPWSVAIRPEFCRDTDGRWTGFEQTVDALTTTLEYRLPVKKTAAILRAEYRYDNSTGPGGGFFSDTGALVAGQQLLIGAAILTFDHSR